MSYLPFFRSEDAAWTLGLAIFGKVGRHDGNCQTKTKKSPYKFIFLALYFWLARPCASHPPIEKEEGRTAPFFILWVRCHTEWRPTMAVLVLGCAAVSKNTKKERSLCKKKNQAKKIFCYNRVFGDFFWQTRFDVRDGLFGDLGTHLIWEGRTLKRPSTKLDKKSSRV